MNRLKQTKEKGFTIIEVMIVLAIAGVILLIVFLAVPALQRANRNTQRKNDAARISGLVNEYVANHGGSLPAGVATSSCGATDLCLQNTSLSLEGTPIISKTGVAPTGDVPVIEEGYDCNTTSEVIGAGSARSFTVNYTVEQSSGTALPQCI